MKKAVMLGLLLLVALSTLGLGKEIIVISTADSGTGSFRWALEIARSGDTITFDPGVFPPDDPAKIYPRSELPQIHCGNLTIDASNAGVILDGSNAQGEWVVGLGVDSDGNTIQGLQIVDFSGAGILLSGQHNIIGGDRSVGHGPLGQGNLLSANSDGIGIAGGPGTVYNRITGNLIGTDVTRKGAWGNQYTGIFIEEKANSNVIGPNNIIAYNGCSGIEIRDVNSFGNIITKNSIHDNGQMGISLRAENDTGPSAPLIFDFDLEAGTVAGSACANCIIEIFSDSDDEGATYEGQTRADNTGSFTFSKGGPFKGCHLTATATDADGNTSAFSLPISVGSMKLQKRNTSPGSRLVLRTSAEIPDNHIGTLMDLNDRFYEEIVPSGMEKEFIRTYEEIGVKRMRLLLDNGDFPDVDWSTRQASTRLAPRQVSTIAGFADAGINVICTLIFWDVAARGQRTTPGYSRFKDEREVIRFLGFVREAVRRLRGHVAYYELLNEPNAEVMGPTGTQQDVRLPDYVNLVERVVPIIRQEDPKARIAVGAVANIQRVWQEPIIMNYLFGLLESRVMPLVDAITFHPMYNITPQDDAIQQYYVGYPHPDVPPRAKEVQQYYERYPNLLRRMRATATAHGFQGKFIADELTWWSPNEDMPIHYPAPPLLFPETQAAKYYGRAIILHLGMDVTAQVRLIPDFGHVETRTIQNLCTLMAGHEAIDMPVKIEIDYEPVAYCAFRYPNGDRMLAIWTDGIAQDEDPGTSATITFPGLTAGAVTGIDVLHGFEQELVYEKDGNDTVIRDLLVKDYPILIKLSGITMGPDYEETVGDGFHRLGDVDAVPSSAGSSSDRDGDGVPDAEDYCPDWPGSKEANGC